MPLAGTRAPERAARWKAHATALKTSIERDAWDGAWYRRATFDDGTWLGSKDSDECRIDSIAQSWAVLSGAADPERAATAMASLESHLIRKEDSLALLFTPPFNATPRDPGYIKGYPPGLRENGGQYSHAAVWAILAFAKLGQGDKPLSGVIRFPLPRIIEATGRSKVNPRRSGGWELGFRGWIGSNRRF